MIRNIQQWKTLPEKKADELDRSIFRGKLKKFIEIWPILNISLIYFVFGGRWQVAFRAEAEGISISSLSRYLKINCYHCMVTALPFDFIGWPRLALTKFV